MREGPRGEVADALTRRAEEIADTFGEQEISNTVISSIQLQIRSSVFGAVGGAYKYGRFSGKCELKWPRLRRYGP
jgi:hypothetical protein